MRKILERERKNVKVSKTEKSAAGSILVTITTGPVSMIWAIN